MEFGQCGSLYMGDAQYQTCFAGFDKKVVILSYIQTSLSNAALPKDLYF